jgi:GTP-binding protein HflX
VLSEDKLFATLDPTSRKAILPGGRTVILTDTVGFIRKLPHRLIDAFKATLEEALEADLLLHVVDFSCAEFEEQLSTTIKVLVELGAAEKEVITVYNKIDRGEEVMSRLRAKSLTPKCVFVSCKSGDGIADLLALVEQELNGKVEVASYKIPHHMYKLVAKLREQGCLLTELNDENGVQIEASPRGKLKSVLKDFVV